ncbi:MAG: glycosyltransferase family 2 protein [Sphingobacteriales bacterium]|nr:MAG: glycosyltransferase family 2 protein [Sphingobacteriales bacterium]
MAIFKNPAWVEQHNFNYNSVDEVPQSLFDEINRDLDKLQSNEPVVSVVIPAMNEEVNVLKTIASLARSKTKYPMEILVVNNNSTDRTQDTLDRLHVRSAFQHIAGWGPARQKGLEEARGKYILQADADCIYASGWVDTMIDSLQQEGVVCVYGRYSFIAEPGFPRWQLFVWEKLKDMMAEIRHVKRPFLNAYGVSFGYHKEPALKIGFVMEKIRGEDGRMCFDLMKHGKVKAVRASHIRAWTGPRTLRLDGSLIKAFVRRATKEVKRFHEMFVPMPDHDTKTSKNRFDW